MRVSIPSTAAASAPGDAASLVGVVRAAAQATGTRFDYLLKTAMRESSLDPSLTSSTSSATGLYQFIEQTWLATLKAEGGKFGYGDLAAAVSRSASGRHVVGDPALRQRILDLRKDPQAAALMAGAFSARNAAHLRGALGRAPSDGELYIAHFLGPAGAVRLIDRAAQQPDVRAADVFPQAARANRAIFYDRSGAPRSLSAVKAALMAQHERAVPASAVIASASASASAPAIAPGEPAMARGFVAERAPEPAAVHGLFGAARSAPVEGGVAALWGLPARAGTRASGPVRLGAIGAPLDLARFLHLPTRAG